MAPEATDNCAMYKPAALPALFLFLALGVTGCTPDAKPADVLVTIKPIHSLVAKVMKGVGTPGLLIGGGASAHSYSLKPSDARALSHAKLIIWVGPDLENFLVGPLHALAGKAQTLALEYAPDVTHLEPRRGGLWDDGTTPDDNAHNEAHIDPHIWLAPKNAIAMIGAIAAALEKTDPAHAAIYAANAKAAIADLRRLDVQTAAALAPIRARPYIVFHDAYHYFETAYHLSPIGAVTVAPERPVGPRRVETIRSALQTGKAVCIFREPEFSPKLIATLREGTPAHSGVLDPMGANLEPGPDLYDMLIGNLAQSLVRCLAP